MPWQRRFKRAYRKLGWLSIAGPIILITLLVIGAWIAILHNAGLGFGAVIVLSLLAAIPASEAATGLFNTLVTFLKSPSRLVGYAYKHGVPEGARTLVVVPVLITSRDGVDETIRNLEVHYLSHTQGFIDFAVSSDWADSDHEIDDRDRDLLAYAQNAVDELAAKYAHTGRTRFFLFHRRRLWNEREGVWMGWERKRGKLLELNLLLRGDEDTTYMSPAAPPPAGVVHVMTLDSDTRLTRDAVTRLVGRMTHPLNEPVFDAKSGRVSEGYAIMQPRVTPSLTSGEEASLFQRIFSANRGLDPYVFTVSDVYQDLTAEGSFTGKGLYHIDAFTAALKDVHEDNSVLSHDLLEGTIARAALVTDIELVEDFPTRYEVEASRQHRWTRGDWQLLPFILGTGSKVMDKPRHAVSALGRWKMIDNLRRTLVPGAFWLASVIGWCVLSPGMALAWQAALVLSLFVSPTLGLLRGVMPSITTEIVQRTHWRAVISESISATLQVILRIVFIPHSAWMLMDGAARALWRTFVSGRNMLEWKSAAQVQAFRGVWDYFRFMRGGLLLTAIGLTATAALAPQTLFLAVPFSFVWFASPFFAWAVSQSAETEDRLEVTPEDRRELRKIARRTWSYFETFVTPDENYLPPDNFQEDPAPAIAHRTSPTNIGLYLLSVISARDFGWISMTDTLSRLEDTLDTVDKMEKHRGHLLNWYDTRTLAPLLPKYVSAVDSGNLAGHLIALSSTCRDWAEAPTAHVQSDMRGLADVANVLQDELDKVPDDRRAVRPLRAKLASQIEGFQRAVDALIKEPEYAAIRTENISSLAATISRLAGDLHHDVQLTASLGVVEWAATLERACTSIDSDASLEQIDVDHLRSRLSTLGERARKAAFDMDFAFLMNEERRLLSIGYRVEEDDLDESCYDLLASEARLTSLFAIAKGDLPTEHWFRLGRTVLSIGSRGALVSWSGSMFEYLMPPLVMQEQVGGILNQTNRLVVRRQIEYGRENNVPWGISEAAFNARDREMTYQYSNFGVPSLGMKRGLGTDLVIAPYASLLAAQYDPAAAVANLRHLARLGALGRYGFYDAVDFTPTRVPDGEKHAVVKNFMAHHHGMSILSVANVLFHGRLRERFHSDPVIESAELLLQEKAPREVPVQAARQVEADPTLGRAEGAGGSYRSIDTPSSTDRSVNLLSNGHYALMLNATGSGHASWNGLAVTRWRPDQVEDDWGTFLFLRDMDSGVWWSSTTTPRTVDDEQTHTVFSDSKAEFHKRVGTLTSQVDVIVGTEADAEGRCLTLTNEGDTDRTIEVTSYAEPVISASDADEAHPAFSKMFIETRISDEGHAIFAERNKRRPGEPDMSIAHMVTGFGSGDRETQAETDRRRFIGRGRQLANAAAFDPGAELTGTDGFTLDACLSLRRTVRVPAGKSVRLIFWTIAAPNAAEVEQAVANYAQPEAFEREAMHAWTRSQVQLRHVEVDPDEATVFQRLAGYLAYPSRALNSGAKPEDLRPQSALWSVSISGDFPMLVLRIDADSDIEIVRKALRAQEFFRSRGLLADLVIINEQASSYAQDLQNRIDALRENAMQRGIGATAQPHIFALRKDLMDAQVYNAIMSAARAVFHARNGKFSTQIERVEARIAELREEKSGGVYGPIAQPSRSQSIEVAEVDGDGLAFWNGFGGFDAEAREYVVRLPSGTATPQPWVNVMSNERFGGHISAEGAGFTWSANSRDYQLTPWSNDAVVNRPGEAFYLVDSDSGRVFSPLASFGTWPGATFEARHGMGYSRFTRRGSTLDIELLQTVAADDAAKVSKLTITNNGPTRRSFTATGYVEWVLGNSRAKTAPYIVCDANEGALTASNPYSVEFPGRVAWLATDGADVSHCASRADFIGSGTVWQPDSIAGGAPLPNTSATHGDPCAALSVPFALEPGESRSITFVLGDTPPEGDASLDAKSALAVPMDARLEAVGDVWNDTLATLQVETPDPAFDVMVNHWLPYQSIACRIKARSAFYQASGAFGFRDQLQDTLAFLLQDPSLARAQILNAAGRQFPEGDFQHWWLPKTGAGVRTMISDDVVWLAYGVTHYVDVTGDDSVLDEPIPFIEGPELPEGKHDMFFQPTTSERSVSVYEHAALALELAIKRTGQHGLPLMLGGDWNDGMDRVGEAGKGESVWLGWFLAAALDRFTPVARSRGDDARVALFESHAPKLKEALEGPGWDGENYKRGYFDNGAPLGSKDSDECRIDSIAQSWSVLSGLGDEDRINSAMDRVSDVLVRDDLGIVQLFTPPFAHTPNEPGYIKGYPPGVRENGGQYTHAATWVVYALAELGRSEQAYDAFSKLNPVNHALTKDAAETYRVEPYVVAADIYSSGIDGDFEWGEGRGGRGGWTWYTGSGGWLYRAGVEAILGLRRKGDRMIVKPCLPDEWPGFDAELNLDGVTYSIQVQRKKGGGYAVKVDGKAVRDPLKGFALTG